MKFLRFLVCFLLIFTMFAVANAEQVDIESLTVNELLELRSKIDAALISAGYDSDQILTPGDYFVGIDIPEGNAMATYISGDNSYATIYIYTVDNNGGEIIGRIAPGGEHPREIVELSSGTKMTVKGASVAIKYLDD